jgi:elongation factor P
MAFNADVPKKVILEVVEAPPGEKGDTKTNAQKIATLENGKQIGVPLFIKTGEKVVVNTESGTYVERYKQ